MTEPASDLVEVALVHGLGDVPDLAALVGLPLLLVELLRQRLQLGQGHLQGQAVGVANWRVLQHVLAEESQVIARRTDLPEQQTQHSIFCLPSAHLLCSVIS